MAMHNFDTLTSEIRACTHCAAHLPAGPRPVFQAAPSARVLICGQAPGTKVHASGKPFTDVSGTVLRGWLGISNETFYDAEKIAVIPMGLCYPGRTKGGDAPPRPECAPRWHQLLHGFLPNISIILLVGAYAQRYYLGDKRGADLTATVRNWRAYQPRFFPTPHPSPRNRRWLRDRPWFEAEMVPELRRQVAAALAEGDPSRA